jgi:acyl-CoA thioester hydrolase
MHAHTRLIHTSTIALRWGDMDALNHVNNTVYFRFMEQVRIDWLHTLGHVTAAAVDSPVVVTSS